MIDLCSLRDFIYEMVNGLLVRLSGSVEEA